jgi:hypothetical protein
MARMSFYLLTGDQLITATLSDSIASSSSSFTSAGFLAMHLKQDHRAFSVGHSLINAFSQAL